MKKKILLGAIGLIILIAGFFAWKFFGSSVPKEEEGKYVYIRTGSSFDDVVSELKNNHFIRNKAWFRMASRVAGYKNIRPGRYKVTEGMSIMDIVRMLKNGRQSPVTFVITKIRTREGLAEKIGAAFECDADEMLAFLNSPDSLDSFELDTNSAMAAALPLTYEIKWNTTPGKIFQQFYNAYKTFWTPRRKEKADRLNLSPLEVVTIASIIDEETNAPSDRPYIASVYLNRIEKGMRLEADPTLKFALKNFALRRVLNGHKKVESPYNTYMNAGLPPGPICTPALETVDAVLDSPKTDYLFFVANSDFSGTHIFTSKYADHMKYARLYQQELNKRNVK